MRPRSFPYPRPRDAPRRVLSDEHEPAPAMRLFPRHLPLVLAAAAGAAACTVNPPPAPAGPPVDWRSVVGCYRAGDRHFAFDSVPYLAVHSTERGSRLARSDDPWWRRGYDTYWRMTAPDSVALAWDAGLYGGEIRFAVRGDTLAGLHRVYSDVPPYRRRPRRVVAVREPCPADARLFPAPPDPARAALLSGYAATLPEDLRRQADPWRALEPLRAWLGAHPRALDDFHVRVHARGMFGRAATLAVRAGSRELAGTYRLEVQRTGGPTHVVYGRTEVRPLFALPPGDTSTIAPEQPPGYRLRLALSADSASLPRPGPGRRHRTAYGGNTAANSHVDVRLPATVLPDGTRRLRAYVMLVNFASFFRAADRPLYDWDYEWFRREHDFDGVNVHAEFTVAPDGRVTFVQRQALEPGRVVTVRGERISGDAWQCAREDC